MNQHDSERPMQPGERRLRARAAYRAPQLSELGDIRDLTLGTSAGSTDTGNHGRMPIPGVPKAPKSHP